jgi:hypothetical protein
MDPSAARRRVFSCRFELGKNLGIPAIRGLLQRENGGKPPFLQETAGIRCQIVYLLQVSFRALIRIAPST